MVRADHTRANALLGGLALSEVGDRFVLAAMPIVALRLGSPVFLAAVLVAATLPSVLFSGLVARAHSLLSLKAWRISLAGQFAAWCFAAAIVGHSVWLLVGFVLLAGILDVVATPYSRAALHHVNADDVEGLTKKWSTAKSLAGALGMGAGALIASTFGIGPVLWVNALTFVMALAVTFGQPALDRQDDLDAAGRQKSTRVRGGSLTKPQVFGVLGFTAVVVMLCTTSVEGVLGPFMLETLSGFTPRLLGFVMAAWALGAVLCSAFAPAVAQTHKAALPAACVLVAVALGVPSVGAPFLWSFLLFFLGGVGNGIFNLNLSRTIWGGVPATRQASAWAEFNRTLNATILFAFVVGLLAAADHARIVLLTMSALLAGVALGILPRTFTAQRSRVLDVQEN